MTVFGCQHLLIRGGTALHLIMLNQTSIQSTGVHSHVARLRAAVSTQIQQYLSWMQSNDKLLHTPLVAQQCCLFGSMVYKSAKQQSVLQTGQACRKLVANLT